jgi:5-methylcytosine-specific restriction endonuclease McrA
MRKLAARDALSHSHPGADEVAILEAGLDLILERAAKQRGIVSRPRQGSPEHTPRTPRSIPAAVKREVWVRDEGRCQWPTADGGICGSTHRLQFDHVVPVARGGESTVRNLRLACAVHNDLAARQIFGDGWMDRFTRGARRSGADGSCGESHGVS